ncbi:hypothetical protein [Martelella sp. FOR1707]
MAQKSLTAPATPDITTCTTTLIAGTEATPGTKIQLYNLSRGRRPVADPPIVHNGQWSAVPDRLLISLGDKIEAQAYFIGTTITSNPIWKTVDDEPAKPVITVFTPEYFAGTEANPGTAILLTNLDDGRTFPPGGIIVPPNGE